MGPSNWYLQCQLFVALQNNDVSRVAELLARGMDPDIRFHQAGSQHRPALCLCAESGKVDLVELLLKWGCSVNQSDPVDGLTALHIAASHGSVPMIHTLLRHRAHLNAVTPRGLTPLHLASQRPSVDAVRELVEAGANLDSSDGEQKTALLNACIHGHANVARYLIDRGAQVDVVCPGDDNTPLLFVAISPHVDLDLLERLLSAGARVNGQNAHGESALHAIVRAQSPCRVEAIDVLVARGCNPDLKTNLGHTPLHLAVLQRDDVTIAKLVACVGCAVDPRDELGLSPLFYAARDNNMNAVALLLAAGVRLGDQTWLLGTQTSTSTSTPTLGRAPFEPSLLRYLVWRSRQCDRLADICRLTIRARVASPVDENLDKLSLPTTLQRYLKFETL